MLLHERTILLEVASGCDGQEFTILLNFFNVMYNLMIVGKLYPLFFTVNQRMCQWFMQELVFRFFVSVDFNQLLSNPRKSPLNSNTCYNICSALPLLPVLGIREFIAVYYIRFEFYSLKCVRFLSFFMY